MKTKKQIIKNDFSALLHVRPEIHSRVKTVSDKKGMKLNRFTEQVVVAGLATVEKPEAV